MYVENIKNMFHQKYLQKCFLIMLAFLINAGADTWGVGGATPPYLSFS